MLALRKSRSRILIIATVVVLIGAFVVISLIPTRVTVIVPQRREAVQTIVAAARLAPSQRMHIGSLILGVVRDVRGVTGARVQAGQLLAQLDDSEAAAGTLQAEAQVIQARAKVEQLTQVGSRITRQAAREAEALLKSADADLRREETLFQAKATSEESLERARTAVAMARARYESAIAQAAGSAKNGAEMRQTLSAVTQAEALLAAARARQQMYAITAPTQGLILKRDAEPGDVVDPGHTLFDFANTEDLFAVAEIEERFLGQLALNQSAVVTPDAFPATHLDARLTGISPVVNPARGTVECKFRIVNPTEILRVDMSMTLEVETGRNSDALLLPQDAIRDLGTSEPYVLVVRDGRVVKQPVRLGLRSRTEVEVIEGIDNTTPVLPGSVRLKSGTRVGIREL